MHLFCCFSESLQDFKSEVHKLFPLIYDTKFLAFEIRKNPVSKLKSSISSKNVDKNRKGDKKTRRVKENVVFPRFQACHAGYFLCNKNVLNTLTLRKRFLQMLNRVKQSINLQPK